MAKMDPEEIDRIAKGVTHFAFRNGPVENMHAAGKLTQDDMKTLNKFMVNRVAALLTMFLNKDVEGIKAFAYDCQEVGMDWDAAEPDMEAIELLKEIRRLP